MPWRRTALSLLALAAAALGQVMSVGDLLKLPAPPADHRIAYGTDPNQFGYLRLPKGRGPHPVAIVIHGGCWLARFDLEHTGSMCAALTAAGLATWSIEYRRVGNAGGGWPGTFQDIAAGVDHLRALAGRYRLDLKRVVAVGHSAGGHLALWAAARHRLPPSSTLYRPKPLPLRGVVSLAGVGDLRSFAARTPAACGDAIPQLVGTPENYPQASPIELLRLGVPQRLINGALDRIVPVETGQQYEAAARKAGGDVRLTVLESAGHFEVVAPQSAAWPVVEQAVLSLLRQRGR
jgi:acetyl esterase/lipase